MGNYKKRQHFLTFIFLIDLFWWWWDFKIGSYYVALPILELTDIYLLLPLEWWD